jgi:hypothetical protein
MGWTGKAKGGRQYDEDFQTPVFLTAEALKPFIDKDLTENSARVETRSLTKAANRDQPAFHPGPPEHQLTK